MWVHDDRSAIEKSLSAQAMLPSPVEESRRREWVAEMATIKTALANLPTGEYTLAIAMAYRAGEHTQLVVFTGSNPPSDGTRAEYVGRCYLALPTSLSARRAIETALHDELVRRGGGGDVITLPSSRDDWADESWLIHFTRR